MNESTLRKNGFVRTGLPDNSYINRDGIIYKDGRTTRGTKSNDSTNKNTQPYYRYVYRSNGKRVSIGVHRLVAYAFLENTRPEEYDIINHIDGNPSNNHSDNLEWTTKKLNNQHAVVAGLNTQSVKVFLYDAILDVSHDRHSINHAASIIGCSPGTISGYINNQQNKFLWGRWLVSKTKDFDLSSITEIPSIYGCILGREYPDEDIVFVKTDIGYRLYCNMEYALNDNQHDFELFSDIKTEEEKREIIKRAVVILPKKYGGSRGPGGKKPKRLRVTYKDGTIRQFDTVRDLALELGFTHSALKRRIWYNRGKVLDMHVEYIDI